MKKHNYWKKTAMMAATAAMLMGSCTPAFAYVSSGTEEQLLAETELGTEGTEESETADVAGQEDATADSASAVTESTEFGTAFSTPGTATLQDSITDGSSKEFYTIRTANNNTFYLVVDKSATSNNVYMLSAVDESDLTEFLSDEELEALKESSESSKTGVVLPETTKESAETESSAVAEVTKPEEEKKSSSMKTVMTTILLLALGAVGAYYYFKIYKPGKQTVDNGQDQGMEQEDFPDDEENSENE